MKKVIYSSYTKIAAVVLFVLCAVLCVNVLLDGFMEFPRTDDYIYGFEGDFKESEYLEELVQQPLINLRSAYYQYYSHDNNMTLDECIKDRLEYLNDLGQINYYITVNDTVYTNCGAGSIDDLANKPFSLYTELSEGNFYSTSSNGHTYSRSYGDDFWKENTDEIKVCASINEKYAAECEARWKEQEAQFRSIFTKSFIYIILSLLFFIYLIAVTGKNSDGQYNLMLIDRMWTELHLLIIVIVFVAALAGSMVILDTFYSGQLPVYVVRSVIPALTALAVFIILSLLLSIIRKLKCKKFFEGSIICRIIRWIFRGIKSFFKIVICKTSMIFIVFLFVYTVLIGGCGLIGLENPWFIFAGIIIFLFASFLLANCARDFDEIRRGAGEIKGGNLSYKIPELKIENIKLLAKDINEIGMGLDESVSAKLKAERLKTELITNVSHDLKTPLTSIISYTELLSKVDGLPDEAKDYVQVIAKKSNRLKTLTQDLFDISKVQSGNENIVFERLDTALLINQSLGEHNSEIQKSGLKFCVETEKDLYISADGRKMSRVLSNLIGNVLKYAMKNTRVFISAYAENDEVVIEIKNISELPLDFDAEEITGRFVRGDESRTIEGSGLGLAIAKTYTEACGGSFSIVLDGDMFKAIIKFNKKAMLL